MTNNQILHDLQEITNTTPAEVVQFEPKAMLHWYSVVTVTLLTAILTATIVGLTLQIWELRKNNARTTATTKSLTNLAQGNQAILEELKEIVKGGDKNIANAILAVINDNRRVHGCVLVSSFDALDKAPSCAFSTTKRRPPHTHPTTSTTAPPSTGTVSAGAPPATLQPVTPTSRPCKLGLLGLCIIS